MATYDLYAHILRATMPSLEQNINTLSYEKSVKHSNGAGSI